MRATSAGVWETIRSLDRHIFSRRSPPPPALALAPSLYKSTLDLTASLAAMAAADAVASVANGIDGQDQYEP
jgi:hypothetical protein